MGGSVWGVCGPCSAREKRREERKEKRAKKKEKKEKKETSCICRAYHVHIRQIRIPPLRQCTPGKVKGGMKTLPIWRLEGLSIEGLGLRYTPTLLVPPLKENIDTTLLTDAPQRQVSLIERRLFKCVHSDCLWRVGCKRSVSHDCVCDCIHKSFFIECDYIKLG